jgi:hypothetical protein
MKDLRPVGRLWVRGVDSVCSDGTVVRVRLDKKATSVSLLVVLGVREDGQKLLLAVKNMGGETKERFSMASSSADCASPNSAVTGWPGSRNEEYGISAYESVELTPP